MFSFYTNLAAVDAQWFRQLISPKKRVHLPLELVWRHDGYPAMLWKSHFRHRRVRALKQKSVQCQKVSYFAWTGKTFCSSLW